MSAAPLTHAHAFGSSTTSYLIAPPRGGRSLSHARVPGIATRHTRSSSASTPSTLARLRCATPATRASCRAPAHATAAGGTSMRSKPGRANPSRPGGGASFGGGCSAVGSASYGYCSVADGSSPCGGAPYSNCGGGCGALASAQPAAPLLQTPPAHRRHHIIDRRRIPSASADWESVGGR